MSRLIYSPLLDKIMEPRHEKTCLRVFPSRSNSNWPVQLQKLAWGLNVWWQKLETLHYPGSEQQRRWSHCADAQADLRLCCSHMTYGTFSHGPAQCQLCPMYRKVNYYSYLPVVRGGPHEQNSNHFRFDAEADAHADRVRRHGSIYIVWFKHISFRTVYKITQ